MPKDQENTSTPSGTSAGLTQRSHEVVDEVRQATLERVDSMRSSAQSAKDRAAERVRKFGATVRKVGEHMRVEDQRYIAEKANDASERLETLASYLSSAEIGTLLRDTSALARRNPGIFFGGALVVGLAAGRFLKGGVSLAGSTFADEPSTGVTRRPGRAVTVTDTPEPTRAADRSQDRPATPTTMNATRGGAIR